MPRSRRYLLLCGSTLLNVADPHVEFFQSQLQPWVHYVPVAQDFSDLNARLQWLGDNQVEAQKIGEAGRDWALKHLQPHSLVLCSAHESPHLVVAHVIVFVAVGFHARCYQRSDGIAEERASGAVVSAVALGHQDCTRELAC